MLLMMRLVCWSLFTAYVSLLPAQACCSTQIRAADGGSVVEQLGLIHQNSTQAQNALLSLCFQLEPSVIC